MSTAVIAGALASAAFWLIDRMSLPETTTTLSLELRLLAAHLAVGGVLGALSGALVRDHSSRLRVAGTAGAFTIGIVIVAVLSTVAHYPQLVADRWWLAGGALATLQRFVTHTVGPLLLDALWVLPMGAAVAVALARIARSRPKLVAEVAAAAAVVVAIRFVLAIGARANAIEAPPDVLVIASAALRTDRLESADTMPYVSSRIPDGTLYRHAVTPIARSYPGWVSTLTGTEPRVHDVRHDFPALESRRDVGPTLFTELRDRGYFTYVAAGSAGVVFSSFDGGFERIDAPRSRSTALGRHTFSLPLLRFRSFRKLFPEWRRLPAAAIPRWIVDEALSHLDRRDERPAAGLVVFGNTLAPYVSPYPYYRQESDDYRGDYLYHVPTTSGGPSPTDVRQIRARFDGALGAVDTAIARLLEHVHRPTLVIITGVHGEELYEEPGLAGHGDALQSLRSQAAPILLLGPGVPEGVRSSAPARHTDLPATVLDRLGISETFGHGVTLFDEDAPRPVCVETGIWTSPTEPQALRGDRLTYAPLDGLVELEPSSGEPVLRRDVESLVETAKFRGVIAGRALYRERLTPNGLVRETVTHPDVEALTPDAHELRKLFEERCIDGDENLSRLYGVVVFERGER